MATTTHEPVPAGKSPGGNGLSPRQRQRISRAAQYVLFVVVVAGAIAVADWGKIHEYLLDTKALDGMFPDLFTVALKNTILYTAAAYVVGFVIGLIIALMRLSSVAPYRWFGLVFIEIFRGLPALLILILVAFGLPIAFPSFSNPPGGVYTQVAIGLGLVAAAYMAETIRAGIQAVPKGQMEAARSLGMSHTRAMISIIIPQALRVVVPPLTNELVLLFKDSSLVFIIGVSATQIELTKMGESFATQKADSTPIVAAGLAYLVITIPLGYLVRRLEARQVKAR
ncbi:amino acid ABC transporter permease [Actinomadura sp. HBU206391]|uniref:amino acid ABC transporter permease n=1 Tax=Actinomadura sp. HBU206391 TaxID=2731692 RepID=UPI00164FAB1A|nr:amino acid ABC transporter permease [Actinomadura sp. HBU206391]MBC6459280.1 amino acid ABC transporter permease [Actinomadura sp. HBU206391]